MKGSRVQSIIRELRGEKIDIIEYSDDLVTFAQSALAPAKITRVSVHHVGAQPHLDVIVEDEQLSLAIGKRGQNVRLAAELIGCKIDIKSESDVKDEVAGRARPHAAERLLGDQPAVPATDEVLDLTTVPGIGARTAGLLEEAGFSTLQSLLDATPSCCSRSRASDRRPRSADPQLGPGAGGEDPGRGARRAGRGGPGDADARRLPR